MRGLYLHMPRRDMRLRIAGRILALSIVFVVMLIDYEPVQTTATLVATGVILSAMWDAVDRGKGKEE